MTTIDTASDAPPVKFHGTAYRSERADLSDDAALVVAFGRYLQQHPETDPHAGLCALVYWCQGDELDAEERALLATLTSLAREAVPA